MTELLFPGGVARIDEGRVWRLLADARAGGWLYSIVGHPDGVTCVLTRDGESHTAHSRLGPADAVANALQCLPQTDT